MMRITFLIFTLLISKGTVFSQNSYHLNQNFMYLDDESGHFLEMWKLENVQSAESSKTVEKRKQDNLKTLSATSRSNKGKLHKVTYFFNELGRYEGVNYKTSKGKTGITTIDYLNDSIISQVKTYTSKGDTLVHKFSFITINKKIFFEKSEYIKNNKIQESYQIKYDERSNVISRSVFNKKVKYSNECKLYYNLDNEHIKSEYYYKNKLKSVYNYDCSSKGKIVEDKSITTSNVCKWEQENRDGSYVKYERSILKKSQYLTISKYDKDSVLFEKHKFLNDSILISTVNVYENFKVIRIYKNNQKLKRYFTSLKDERSNEIESVKTYYNRLRGYQYSILKSYNEDNLVLEKTVIKNKRQPITDTYKYNDQNLMIEKNTTQKNRRTKTSIFQFNEKGYMTYLIKKVGCKKKEYERIYSYTFYNE